MIKQIFADKDFNKKLVPPVIPIALQLMLATVSGLRTTGYGYYERCAAGFENNLIEITE